MNMGKRKVDVTAPGKIETTDEVIKSTTHAAFDQENEAILPPGQVLRSGSAASGSANAQ